MRRLSVLTVLIACSAYAVGQNITSITCYRSWTGTSYTSCLATIVAPADTMACDCAATCGSNCANISADYEVYWAVTAGNSGTGTISGGAKDSLNKYVSDP